VRVFNSKGTLYWCGNGGSAAEAQHMAAELIGTFTIKNRMPIKSFSLTTDTSILTSISNDLSFDLVFSRQVQAFNTEDMLIAISTSGNSKNIKNALVMANTMNIPSVLMTGNEAGICSGLSTIEVKVPSTKTPRIQECHTLINHYICSQIELITESFK
jgi:D-sedoheptulose 7-phosphate isomerase